MRISDWSSDVCSSDLGMAVAAFVAIFFLDAPFPLIVLTAALAGFLGGRAGLPAFQVGGGHASMGADVVHDRDTALGEGLPDHARPNLAWSLNISGALLFFWLAPVALLFAFLGPADVFPRIATSLRQMAMVTFGGAYSVLSSAVSPAFRLSRSVAVMPRWGQMSFTTAIPRLVRDCRTMPGPISPGRSKSPAPC